MVVGVLFVCFFLFPFSSIFIGFVLFEIHHPGRNYSLLGKHPSFKKVIQSSFLTMKPLSAPKEHTFEKKVVTFSNLVKDRKVITVSNLVKDRKVSSRQILKCN